MTSQVMQGKVERIGLAFVEELMGDRHCAHYAVILEGVGRLQFKVDEAGANRFATALALTRPGDFVYITFKPHKDGALILDSFRNSVIDNVPLK